MVDSNNARRGERLEYLVASVFQGQGYLVRNRIPIRYEPDGEDAPDIDVLGIKFTQPFQPHRIICDCRERGKPKPYERIFWVRGLASFVDASETYVAFPKCSLGIINYARSGQVRVLTKEVLQDYLRRIYGIDSHPHGLANASFFEPLWQRLSPVLKKEKEARDIFSQAKSLYIVGDPYVSVNIALGHLKTVASRLKVISDTHRETYDLWKFIAAELTVMTSLLILYIASDTIGISKDLRGNYIVERLTYGDIPPQKAKEIFGYAKELVLKAASALAPGTSRQGLLSFDIGRIDAPSYAQNVAGLVERAINSPLLYHELPQLVDFLLFEQSLQNRGFSDEEYRSAFPSPMQDERLKVARNVFAFLRDNVGLDLKVFWPKEENNLPKRRNS